MSGTPWTFNNHLLLLHRLQEGDDLNLVPLCYAYFWVQVHDLPSRFFSDYVAEQLGDFVGKFLEHDIKQITQGHGNRFCQKRINLGLKEVEYGWDISLKAQSRRASVIPSVWLRDDKMERNLEKIRGKLVAANNNNGEYNLDMRQNKGFITQTPGINLEGKNRCGKRKGIV
ncbi:hypothetical protein Godav_004043 [Gossypium davidsonii]|uniref:DUF4283 domain-containing protein n=2 Tax=Gossypium TaxID=3633 RepID=A0A7J8SJR2_GOSDV|nr:hypothetical protein [Gossypium davidsonii]MBA0661974.1 hypothetical protein [Gossypium klotzschianum]